MNADAYRIDTRAARRAFARAIAAGSDAFLLREVSDRTLQHLDPIRIAPRRILELHCGAGRAADGLMRRYPRAALTAAGLAAAQRRDGGTPSQPLRHAQLPVCADLQALPFAAAAFDLVFASLALHWADDLERSLAECQRVLTADGLFLFATFGPDTLRELRASFRQADRRVHVHAFIDMHDLGDLLIAAGFSAPILDTEIITVEYRQLGDLFRDLQSQGLVNVATGRSRGLLGRDVLQAASRAYAELRTETARFPASFEIVYGHCWRPSAGTRPQDGSTVATFPLSGLRRR